MIDYSKYSNIIFDFDGVIVDSNFIKEECISKASQNFCNKVLHEKFVKYFIANNGIPRQIKIKKFFNIQDSEKILLEYERFLQNQIETINLTKGAKSFLNKLYPQQTLYMLSGGTGNEIKQILLQYKLRDIFYLIMSGPKTKEENLQNIILKGNTLFIGDSKTDYEVAIKYNFDFIFMYGYTQFKEWKSFFHDKKIKIIKDLEELNFD